MTEGPGSRGGLNVNFVRDGDLLKNLDSSLGIHPRSLIWD